MKAPVIKLSLNHPFVLYFVLMVALANLLYLSVEGNMAFAAVFLLVGFLTSFFSKNMTVILVIAIVATNVLQFGSGVRASEGFAEGNEDEKKEDEKKDDEGFAEGNEDEKKEGDKKKGDEKNDDEKKEDEKKEVDKADAAVERMTEKQKQLVEKIEKIEPMVKQVESFVAKLEKFSNYK